LVDERSASWLAAGWLFTILLPALWSRLRAWKWALAIGVGASLAVESLQLVFSAIVGFGYRSVDIDDVIVNAVGALVGYALFLGLRALMARRDPVRHPTG
jgi:glycopeptide antibiotics resistance protein